ncbi:CHAT domain-containing protein [Cytophaga aurantiaca]|uniref:CHAT domain-containing protein n=1 Tax=Cytophaga aurantiaca TaxID=29530 RepID=UPI000366D34E|nr:CHAT domain-containing protein [Cytophaga aurantiaca]
MKKFGFLGLLFVLQVSAFAQILTQNQIKADSLFELGEYASSMEYYSKEIALYKESSVSYYLYCQIRRAECAIRLNDLDAAQDIVDEATKHCSIDLFNELALLKNCRAKIYYQKGLLDQADFEISDAIDQLTIHRFYWKSVLAECYNTQGLINWIQGNDEKALEYFNESLKLRRELLDEGTAPLSSPDIAAVYNNIGLVYSGFDLDESLYYYELALHMYQDIYSPNNPALAVAYSNLGQIYRKQKVYNTSLVQYEKALAIWNERYKDAHPNKAFVYSSIAQVFQEKKAYDSSLVYANKALAIYQKAYGEKHPNTAACYTLIGAIYSEQRDYNSALKALQQSLISNCSSFSSADYTVNPKIEEYFDGQLLLSTLMHKGIVLSKREAEKTLRIKDLTLALSTYQSCDTLLDQLRQTRTGKNDKLALGVYSYDVYDKSIELCLLLSESTFKKKYYLKLAYYFVERSKASVLQESIAESKAKEFAGIPNTELEKEDTYKTKISYLEQKLAKGIADETMMKNVASDLFDAKREYEFFIRSLEKNYPAYYNLKYNVQSITIEALQSKLKPEDCILEYFVSESTNTVRVFRITNKEYKVYSIPLMETYEKYISGMRNSIKFDNKPTFIKTSAALYKQLIPALPKACTHLIIIPDGKMGSIPFEALLRTVPKIDTAAYAQMDFLIKQFSISYTYAGSLYENKLQQKSSQRVLLFAPVDFSEASDLTSLPGTLKEVDALNDLFKNKSQVTLFTYKNASRKVLIGDSIRQYSIIHLATHGLVDEEQPELSCIYTYGTSEENDRIYSGDIYNMHLNADLVSLSACQTGLGKIAKGEGLIGLSRALFYAGADNITVSLWKVSDASTQVYMNDFYAIYLNGNQNDFAQASREAKLKLLNSSEFSNPYYWSAFILIGN